MPATPPEPFTALLDDAAVFPPGNAPLPVAVERHVAHRHRPYAAMIGPLLFPATAAGDLRAIVEAQGLAGQLAAVLIVRPDGDPGVLPGAARELDDAGVTIAGAELGWTSRWREFDLDVPVALEIGRGPGQAAALDDLAHEHEHGTAVIAKFRTGPTPQWAWPDEDELAAVLTAARRRQLPLKLTGGLHHAVRGSYHQGGTTEDNHGVLNVLAAVEAADRTDSTSVVSQVLADRNGAALAATVTAWDESTWRSVRHWFAGVGCCEVTDPLRELADLDVIPDLLNPRPEETR